MIIVSMDIPTYGDRRALVDMTLLAIDNFRATRRHRRAAKRLRKRATQRTPA
ncbi:MAG: hypothetical protein VB934_01760 [Polyangiaceae bacterium]